MTTPWDPPELSRTAILERLDPQDAAPLEAAWIDRGGILNLPTDRIMFYGGSFNPLHYGHVSVIEAALITGGQHIIVCPHSHNLETKAGPHFKLWHRILMLAKVALSHPLASRIHVADPETLDGLQNTAFDALARDLAAAGKEPWVVMGRDAVKTGYRSEMRHLPHLVLDREPYDDLADEVLTGPVVRVETSPALEQELHRNPRVAAKLYDPRMGGFHSVLSEPGEAWPYSAEPTMLVFSERIGDHDYCAFDIPSYAARNARGEWDLFTKAMHFELGREPLGWRVTPV